MGVTEFGQLTAADRDGHREHAINPRHPSPAHRERHPLALSFGRWRRLTTTRVRPSICWVILTMGTRPDALDRARGSLAPNDVLIVVRTGRSQTAATPARIFPWSPMLGSLLAEIEAPGRPAATSSGSSTTTPSFSARWTGSSMRLPPTRTSARSPCDSSTRPATTARRHVPRLGGRDPDRTGDVALFLGGACAHPSECLRAGRRLLHGPVLRARGGRAVLAPGRRGVERSATWRTSRCSIRVRASSDTPTGGS